MSSSSNCVSTSSCIHCGLCLASCPTYLETGNENLSPRGRIYLMRALETGEASLDDNRLDALDSCLGCRACEAACPSGVPYGALLEHCRHHTTRNSSRGLIQDAVQKYWIEGVLPNPELFGLTLPIARAVKNSPLQKWLPEALRFPLELLPEDQAIDGEIPHYSPSTRENEIGTVGLVTGCVMSALFAKTHRATIRVLNAHGFNVLVPRLQTCCGALMAHSGDLLEAKKRAVQNLRAFNEEHVDYVVSNAAGCGSALKEYQMLLGSDTEWASLAHSFSQKTRDFSELLDPKVVDWAPCNYASVTYQDACHLAHAQGVRKPPRDILQRICGKLFSEMQESDVCCGSAGSYNLTQPEMSGRLRRRKVKNLRQSGAKVVVTSNPGCLMQMRAGLMQAGSSMQVMHLAEFLEAHLPKEP